ncbi:MAG: trypsin-like peptidase domain-containing protein [Planctomycetes bacterium]|nr:trypsin-like peptidase domain-containing protein [Planctomycetota bacterium]
MRTPTLILLAVTSLGLPTLLHSKSAQPTNLTELEKATIAIANPCRKATVALSANGTQGTGSIVTPDGLIITAFHCVDNIGREFSIMLSNGKRIMAICVYGDINADVALVKILGDPPAGGWPFRPVRTSSDLKEGDWCVAFGNSAGIQSNRPAPMRLGRVMGTIDWKNNSQLLTDNTMVSGDSGGPLYDIEGKLAGVNTHVDTDTALGNHHARISKVIELWGDTLRGEKDLPSIASLREKYLKEMKISQPKTNGAIPRAKGENKTSQQKVIEEAVRKLFKGRTISDEAMKILLSGAVFDKKTGKLELKLTPDAVAELKEAGLDIAAPRKKLKPSGLSDAAETGTDKLILDALKQQLGVELSEEVKQILLTISTLNSKTGELKFTPNYKIYEKLLKLGVDITKLGYLPKKPQDYTKLSAKLGDSAKDIAKLFPKTDPVITVHSDGKQVALATAVKSNGYLVTKASELDLKKRLGVLIGRKKMIARLIALDEESDLALLKVDAKLSVPVWSKTEQRLGGLLVSPSSDRPMLGVVSNLPYKIPTKVIGLSNGNSAILGVKSSTTNDTNGVLVQTADKKFPAGKAGILKGDLITKWDGKKIHQATELTAKVSKHSPGEKVKVTVERDGKTLVFEVILESAASSQLFALNSTNSIAQKISAQGGALSKRRRNFPDSITHDALIWANDCGGPLYNIDGKVVGINIARYDRTANYALTTASFEAALKRLFASK